ncbi:MAG: hypothetical protein IJ595_09290 [Oscillospiraceae bacterium]|nr:hypothetical protein [Oscillospiraceae bacterium]
MEQMYSGFMALMQGNHLDGKEIEELKKTPIPHGKLVGCSYDSYAVGMQFNSNFRLYISVSLVEDVQQITYEKKEPFCPVSMLICRPKQDVLGMLGELVEQENLSAWSALKYHDSFPRTDCFSEVSLTLYFDDREIGGEASSMVSINVSAAIQHGGGDVINRFYSILEDTVKDAEVLKEVKGVSAMNLGMMSMLYIPDEPPAQTAPPVPPEGAWQCKTCGYTANTGRFCTECGARYEE